MYLSGNLTGASASTVQHRHTVGKQEFRRQYHEHIFLDNTKICELQNPIMPNSLYETGQICVAQGPNKLSMDTD